MLQLDKPGNTKGGSITVPLTSSVSGHTADSKPVKQEVNGTVILPPLVFPDECQGANYVYLFSIVHNFIMIS